MDRVSGSFFFSKIHTEAAGLLDLMLSWDHDHTPNDGSAPWLEMPGSTDQSTSS